MEPTATLNDFVDYLRSRGVDPDALKLDEHGTVVASLEVADLEAAPLARLEGERGDVELLEEIARGGMGVIHLGRQRGLMREVAVKKVRHDAGGTKGSRARATELVAEARVTGALEHPNVVPVYAVGEDEDGEPLLVMKRIEGRSWSSLMRERRGQPGALEAEIRVLIEVAQAAHFAHEKNVLHRDLKPDNVMIGAFDEVYVLDWGLAIAAAPPAPAGLAVADGSQPIAGTPSYMAPEMAYPGEPLDRRTDVYLLGAVLHEIVTGAPPHKGKSLPQLLFSAHLAAADAYGPEVPAELAAICRRALARDPDDRYATAYELRRALEDFLQHASARELAAIARARLEALRALSDDDEDDPAAQRAFAEARFGFRQALRAWPDAQAEADAREAVELMVRRELRKDRPESAAVLLSDAEVEPSLAAEVRERRLEKQSRSMELEAIARAVDPKLGQRGRALTLFAFGPGWFLHQLVLAQLFRRGVVENLELALFLSNGLAVLPFFLIAAWVARRRRTNVINRQLYFITWLTQAVCAGVFGFAVLAPFPAWVALAIIHLILSLAIVATGALDRRILPGLLGAAPGVLLIPLLPAWALELNGALCFLAFGLIAWRMLLRDSASP